MVACRPNISDWPSIEDRHYPHRHRPYRAGADRLLLEALRPNLLVVLFGQNVAGEKRHPLEDDRIVLLHVGGDALAVDPEVVDAGPDERHRIAAVRLGVALDRPDDVFRREWAAVVPDDVLSHV